MAAVLGMRGGMAIAAETTYGTAVTTTRGIPILSENLQLSVARVESAAMKGGHMLTPASNVRLGPVQGAGPISTYLFSSGAGILWEAMLGGSNTVGTTAPYTHTFTLADELPSYSAQVAMGALTSTKVKQVEGLMVASWEIGMTLGEYVTLNLDTVYENEDVVAAGEANDDLAGTFPAGQRAYLAQDLAITIGGNSYCISAATLAGNNTLKVEHCAGSRFITKPTRNGRPVINGSLTMKLDNVDNTLYDAFVAGTMADLVWTLTEGSNVTTINMTARIDGSSPNLSGAEELLIEVPYVVNVDDDNGDTDDDAFYVEVVNGDSTP